ncbi:LLM class F420-dependent oxidoreductase [Ilumatobacter coccineus]|uniref:Putative oxidoreductase n=1 Tax=Ilumatobacter coccineus (strain NBRC 103263 / KCTC 29153 / YM16-304) TaxID=1313172 RepID=A0A6C7EA60_ILUCY|nr:LLM class F420-dependent oxidoreductase [Ilumatobacter coccineus]BAN00926.1 putative oxidoreductase [Ilumatobacter coccineus YM16-304]
MKFGVVSSNTGERAHPAEAKRFAQLVEQLGYESIWTVEHVAIPGGFDSPYPYTDDGEMPGGNDLVMSDPLVWMAYVAAVTDAVKLATGVLVLPLNHPVRLAKAVATLDLLSSGRVILGLGVGWLREEAELLDAPWDRRGVRSEEQIAVMRALWSDAQATYRGEFYDLDRVRSFPKPSSPAGPPIVLGGHSEAVAKRAGRLADGFIPAPSDIDDIAHLIGVMRGAAVAAGRDPDAIEVTCSRVRDVDSACRLAELGVSRLNVIPPARADDVGPRLEAYWERVAAPLAERGY